MSQDTFSWKKVETFIGRADYLIQVTEWLQDNKFHLLAISGEYGYGKTRFLKELLSKATALSNLAIPAYLIDLYQTENHSPQGLAQAIVKAFSEKYSDNFQDYEKYKKERDEALAAGSWVGVIRQFEEKMLNACAAGLQRLSQKQPFLLLLDTAERWVYPTLPEFPFSEESAPALEWLLKTCQNLPQGTIVLAGRPEIENLELPNAARMKLNAFTKADIQEYLKETSKQLAASFNLKIQFTEQEIDALTELSQGRPILLALFLERILHGDQTIRQSASGSTPGAFESILIKNLAFDKNIGELLRYAGRAPKGVTLDMLCRMTGSKPEEISKEFEILKDMSFAKTFEGNERLFLHEEMYAMLGRHIYTQPGDGVEADKAAQGLYAYYRQNTSELNQTIGKEYVRYASKRPEDKDAEKLWKSIEEKRQNLQVLNAEFAYYRWLHSGKKTQVDEDPIEMGLRRYYRIGHEAATSGEHQMLVWLRFELIRFIHALQEKESQGQPQPWLPFLRGFLYVQEVWEKNASTQSADVLKEIDERMLPGLNAINRLPQEQKQVLSGILKAWQGMFHLYWEPIRYDQAEKIFTEVIDSLREQSAKSDSMTWFAKSTLALAYRQRAYLRKRQYALNQAIQDYKKAAKINRALDFNFEEALIRNDLGDTQVLTGDFYEAKLNLQDAFDLRQQMKNGARLALSYSTLARYFTATGAVAQARTWALKGINLSTSVGRGTALARISFAEATRRYAGESGTSQEIRDDFFEQADDALKKALTGLNDPILLLDGLIEQACLYRDRMRYATDDEAKKNDFELAEKQYQDVYKTAGEQQPANAYRMADAMSNRIWLGLFSHDVNFIAQAMKDFQNLKIFPVDINGKGAFLAYRKHIQENGKDPSVQFVGKYYVGCGTFALGEDGQLSQDEAPAVAQHWMLGLEYSRLFAESYRGLSAAEHHIYNKIRKFNDREIAWLLGALEWAEEFEGIEKSHLRTLIEKNFGD